MDMDVGSSFYPTRPPPPVPTASRISIKMALKPQYCVAPSPPLLPEIDEVPHTSFQFDFDLERRILEDAEKKGYSLNNMTPAKLSSSKNGETAAPLGAKEDHVVNKYAAMGLNKEAVVLAVATFGDVQAKDPSAEAIQKKLISWSYRVAYVLKFVVFNVIGYKKAGFEVLCRNAAVCPEKVSESVLFGQQIVDFVQSYNHLREMGFPPDAVAGALAMYDNDKERALAHLVA